MRLAELPSYLEMLAVRAGEAAIPGADAMGGDFRDEVKRRLTIRSHPRGTRTPSAPGEPPARESGDLAASVSMDPATTPVIATATVGPNMPPRDAVQEFGMAGIRPVRTPFMVYEYDGLHFSKVVNVPERSYMRSTAELMAGDGRLADAAAEAFYRAMWG